MLRTISIGTCILVQGIMVRGLPNGKIAVRVGQEIYEGYPVSKTQDA